MVQRKPLCFYCSTWHPWSKWSIIDIYTPTVLIRISWYRGIFGDTAILELQSTDNIWQYTWRAPVLSQNVGSCTARLTRPWHLCTKIILCIIQEMFFHEDQGLCNPDLPVSCHTKKSTVLVWFLSHFVILESQEKHWFKVEEYQVDFLVLYHYRNINNNIISYQI